MLLQTRTEKCGRLIDDRINEIASLSAGGGEKVVHHRPSDCWQSATGLRQDTAQNTIQDTIQQVESQPERGSIKHLAGVARKWLQVQVKLKV